MKKLITLLLIFNTAYATSYKWGYNANGNWNNSSNWLPSGIPGASDDVIIASTATITVDVAIKCKSITVDSVATLICNYQLTTGNLTIDQNLTLSGPQMTLITGSTTFGYNCQLIINNKANFNGGGITMGGDALNTITNNGTLLITGAFIYGLQSTMNNYGTVHFTNAVITGPVGSFVFKNTGIVQITGGTLDLQTQ